MEQYNRLTSEGRSCEEKVIKKEPKTEYSLNTPQLVETMPYTAATAYPSYAWGTTAATPWWPEASTTWPLTYSTNVTSDSPYAPYLPAQFQGLLSATVPTPVVVAANSASADAILQKPLTSSTANLPQIGGGKFPNGRSNCECPNCQEAERIGLF